MSKHLKYIDTYYVNSYKKRRANEHHIADAIALPDENLSLKDNLAAAKSNDVQYVILGVPEDIGPRANCGKGGADKGWSNFLPVFLNQQSNHYFDWSKCLLLGEVDVEDLQHQSYQVTFTDHKLTSLRELCDALDKRVMSVLKPIFSQDLEVILIGGGHNNAYPLIASLANATGEAVACANLDPHADFRATEGRHSGNPFRYAYEQELLSHYCVVGLHEQKNNQNSLDALDDAGFPYYTLQNLKMRATESYEDQLFEAREYVAETAGPIGIELDLDAIKNTGASAYSVTGFSVEEAVRYVYRMSTLRSVRYIHLCEGAPSQHENSEFTSHEIGQTLTQLVYAYMQARVKKEPQLPL
jgi:formiminoglutamase